MSIELYDNALLKKIQYWTNDTDLSVLGVDDTTKLFNMLADKSNDKPPMLPLITLSRPGGFSISEKYKQPKAYSGATLSGTQERSAKLNAVKIAIPYRINIYARYQSEADEYIRNIVFNIINFPNVRVDVPYYDLGVLHDSNIILSSDVEDNSQIPERIISGQFTRYTVDIILDNAYLFDVKIKDNVRIVDIAADTTSTANHAET